MTTAAIPHRSVFRAQDVCEIAQVQPYVLRSWETEFPDLGIAKGADGPRMYRRADVELVLKLKNLLFVDGLTLAGARRRLVEEGVATPAPADDEETITDADVALLMDKQTRKGLHDVRQGLGWILEVLNGGVTSRSARTAKQVRSSGRLRIKAARAAKARPAKARPKPSSKGKRTAGRKKR